MKHILFLSLLIVFAVAAIPSADGLRFVGGLPVERVVGGQGGSVAINFRRGIFLYFITGYDIIDLYGYLVTRCPFSVGSIRGAGDGQSVYGGGKGHRVFAVGQAVAVRRRVVCAAGKGEEAT